MASVRNSLAGLDVMTGRTTQSRAPVGPCTVVPAPKNQLRAAGIVYVQLRDEKARIRRVQLSAQAMLLTDETRNPVSSFGSRVDVEITHHLERPAQHVAAGFVDALGDAEQVADAYEGYWRLPSAGQSTHAKWNDAVTSGRDDTSPDGQAHYQRVPVGVQDMG